MCCSRHGWTRRPPGASSAPARAPRWHQTTTGGYVGNIQTGQVLAFCIGDHSVQIKLRDVPDVRDGDRVTLAGKLKDGTFLTLALCNDQIRAVYSYPATPGYIMRCLMVALGVPLLFILVGVLFIGFGGFTL